LRPFQWKDDQKKRKTCRCRACQSCRDESSKWRGRNFLLYQSLITNEDLGVMIRTYQRRALIVAAFPGKEQRDIDAMCGECDNFEVTDVWDLIRRYDTVFEERPAVLKTMKEAVEKHLHAAVYHVVTKPKADAAIARRLKGFCEFVDDDLKGKIIGYVEATAALMCMRKQLVDSVAPDEELAKLMLEKRRVTLHQADRAKRPMGEGSLPHTYDVYREACEAVIKARTLIRNCTMTGYRKVHQVREIKAKRTKNRKEKVDLRSFFPVSGTVKSTVNRTPRCSNSPGKSPGKRSSPTKPETPSPKRSRAEGADTPTVTPTASATTQSTPSALPAPKPSTTQSTPSALPAPKPSTTKGSTPSRSTRTHKPSTKKGSSASNSTKKGKGAKKQA